MELLASWTNLLTGKMAYVQAKLNQKVLEPGVSQPSHSSTDACTTVCTFFATRATLP